MVAAVALRKEGAFENQAVTTSRSAVLARYCKAIRLSFDSGHADKTLRSLRLTA